MATEREALCHDLARIGSVERRLVEACERLLAVHGPVTLPTGDLVHGDAFVHQRHLQPGIQNIGRLVERVEMLRRRTSSPFAP